MDAGCGVVDEEVVRGVGQARALPEGDRLSTRSGVDGSVPQELAHPGDVGRDRAHEPPGGLAGVAPGLTAVLGGDGLAVVRALVGIELLAVDGDAVDGVEGEAHGVAVAGGGDEVGGAPPVVPAVGMHVLVLGELQVAVLLVLRRPRDRETAPRRPHGPGEEDDGQRKRSDEAEAPGARPRRHGHRRVHAAPGLLDRAGNVRYGI